MARGSLIWWFLGGGLVLAAVLSGGAVMYAWEESAEGRKWAPLLAAAEQRYGLPAGLLSRQAAKESSFDPDIIYGNRASPAGALGILQLEPAYFSSVNVPVPFTDQDVAAQIEQAAAEDARLYRVFGDWSLALAAYNWGERHVQGQPDPAAWPSETQNYVSAILADVPAAQAA